MKYLFMALVALFGAMMTTHFTFNPAEQEKLTKEAYIYGFPLVLMDVTKDVFTATPSITSQKAPINQFLNIRTFPDPSFKEIVSPNADTLYSQAWLDLSQGPIVLSIPDMGLRYFLFPLLDAWTNVFFSPGTRTTGNGKQNWAITPPGWKGELPKDVQQVKAPTNIVWIIGRIQTNGKSDYPAVNRLQNQFKLTPLSAWGRYYIYPVNVPFSHDVNVKTPPLQQVFAMDAETYFNRLSELLKKTNIPEADASTVRQFEEIGLVPGQPFMHKESVTVEELNKYVTEAQAEIAKLWDTHPFAENENGWGVIRKGVGDYGTNYNLRAAVAYGGLGANLPEDAIYPTVHVDDKGEPLSGKNNYIIHFDKDDLPPVGAFWSITMYDSQHYFVPNPIDRYALGDRDKLMFNPDESLDIYIQNTSPGKAKESNWLPAPEDDFSLVLRLYQPKEAIITGKWQPPKVERVESSL